MSTLSAQLEVWSSVTHLGAAIGLPQPVQPRLLRTQGGMLLLTVLAAGALAAAGVLASMQIEALPQAFAIAGAVLGAGAGALWRKRLSQRGAVAFFQNGLAFHRADGETVALAWDELDELTLALRDELINGVAFGSVLSLDARAATNRLHFEHFRAQHGDDELVALAFLAQRSAADAAERRLKAGGVLRGEGWSLDHQGLRAEGRRTASLRDVRHAALFEGKVCLWRAGEDEPFFAVRADGPNASLLFELASRQAPQNPADSDTSPFGRVLFKKKASATSVALFAVLAPLLAGPGALFLHARETETLPLGVGLLVAGALCGWGSWWAAVTRFQCQTRGVLRQTPFGTRVLKYTDIERFRYSATRVYHNGAYTGTNVRFAFAPAQPERPITYATMTRGNDADLEFLRDSVAQIVAGTLHQQLAQGGEVRWGRSARLTRTELRYRAKTLFGRGEEQIVRLDEDLRFSIDRGVFHLFVPGAQKAVLDITCADDNFYPGLLLFQRLAAEAHAR